MCVCIYIYVDLSRWPTAWFGPWQRATSNQSNLRPSLECFNTDTPTVSFLPSPRLSYLSSTPPLKFDFAASQSGPTEYYISRSSAFFAHRYQFKWGFDTILASYFVFHICLHPTVPKFLLRSDVQTCVRNSPGVQSLQIKQSQTVAKCPSKRNGSLWVPIVPNPFFKFSLPMFSGWCPQSDVSPMN